MSLMLKLLATIAILSSVIYASDENKVEKYLKDSFGSNPNIKSIKVNTTNIIEIKEHKGWSAYYIEADAILKQDGRQVVQKMLWFSNGTLITKELADLNSRQDISDLVSLPFKNEYYKKENLIYGNANARHKVVIFSDPLCPFCREFVPTALEYMKKDPSKYAVYYYHFPLQSLHPAAVELVQAAIALELKGVKDVVLNLYKVKINPKERSNEVILAEFNKVMNSKITMADLMLPAVTTHFQSDMKIADTLMVNGTPTMFFNGVVDKTKNRYKEAK
ncbi:thioredoxin domain-containing protein [Sulfurimonas sp.]|uniref:thioredoxin domain-containing protein n=1 Tax=Sulfurimonas sp. TaxID=2022749 RepID=UPI0025F71763|nr:thioredoxin domain-containing protein [Sulfurimonas sp.]MDD5156780.1 thioredoxin domain-containing protein [Sulfurimonas sp.]